MLFGTDVHGLDRVPRTGPLILASNHQSFVDSVVIPAVAYGADTWRARGVRFLLHGEQARLEAELAKAAAARAFCEIRHTDQVIARLQ